MIVDKKVANQLLAGSNPASGLLIIKSMNKKNRIKFEEAFKAGDVLKYVNPNNPERWQPLHVVTERRGELVIAVQRGKKYRAFLPMEEGVRTYRVPRFTKIGTIEDVKLLINNPAPENYEPCKW